MTDVSSLVLNGSLIYTLIAVIASAILGYGFQLRMKYKQKEEQDKEMLAKELFDLKERVAMFEQRSVNESRVRDIVREELKPLSTEIHELKGTVLTVLGLVQTIQLDIALDKGYRRAIDQIQNGIKE